MIVRVVGKKIVDFPNKDTGEHIKGINLYVVGPCDDVIGMMATKRWVDTKNQKLYDIALSLDVSKGFLDVDLVYEPQLSGGNPKLVDIKVLQKADKVG